MNPPNNPQPQTDVTNGLGAPLASVPAQVFVNSAPPSHLQTCESCDAPLDALQRYCLNCGTRSRYVSNPAVEFIAAQRKPSRLIPKSQATQNGFAGTGVNKTALPWLLGAVVVALLAGMLLKGGNDNDKLAAAIANQKAPVVNVNGGGGGATAPVAEVTPLTSDFTLNKGYTIQLQTIPSSSDRVAADAAKAAATAKGATKVGLINPTDFTLTPAPAGTDYIIFSGQFKTKALATEALQKLKAKFPDASVLSVAAAGGAAGTDTTADSTGNVSLDKYKASPKKKAADKKKVTDLNKKTGKDYVKAQDDLPPVVEVPVDPNANTDPNALPGGD